MMMIMCRIRVIIVIMSLALNILLSAQSICGTKIDTASFIDANAITITVTDSQRSFEPTIENFFSNSYKQVTIRDKTLIQHFISLLDSCSFYQHASGNSEVLSKRPVIINSNGKIQLNWVSINNIKVHTSIIIEYKRVVLSMPTYKPIWIFHDYNGGNNNYLFIDDSCYFVSKELQSFIYSTINTMK